ncbi:AraC-like DNA-binding protein [Nocardia sp. GAS34]|uniref:AraC family transcriptional regulator n=1 Tax=unclassified Nocardia TaxID=2637762 RepID=UPI003D203B55
MTDLRYEPITHTTSELPESDRIDAWGAIINAHHGEVGFDIADTREFSGTISIQQLGDANLEEFRVVGFESTPVHYRRTPQHVRQDSNESARLVIPVAGRITLRRDEEVVSLEPGQMGMYSCARPLEMEHDVAGAWLLSVPSEALSQQHRYRPPLQLDPQRAMLRSVVSMTKDLAHHRETLSAYEFVSLGNNLVDLLVKSLDPHQATELTNLAGLAADARAHIAKYCRDPAVTVASIAEHLGCSTRQLERALRESGLPTPAKLLQQARLEVAWKRLRDPSDTSSVLTIATESGIRSVSVFTAAFRDRYQSTPSQIRRNRTR